MSGHGGVGGHGGPDLVPVEQHLADCLGLVQPLPPVEVPLLGALDLVLAQDVVATAPLPGADNSGMDGYAVRCSDVAGASPEQPVRLRVVADVAAGQSASGPLRAGTAVRIMTGGVVPEGADGIVPVEQSDGGVGTVSLHAPAEPGRFVRRAGSDVTAGETVLRAGVRLGPRQLSLLAAVGLDRVLVRPAPRVLVVSTGDEVVEPGGELLPGQVFDSNSVGITAAATELGCVARRVRAVGDDEAGFMASLEPELVGADVVVTTGGVSAGAYDVVKAVLRRTGTVDFRKVAVQPGMPQGLGVLGPDGTPILCLPGNPVSALVSFEVFVRPVLRTMLGETDVQRASVRAVVTQGWASPAGKRQYARVRLTQSAVASSSSTQGAVVGLGDSPQSAVASSSSTQGAVASGGHGWTCAPVGGQGSHLVADLATADALAVVPEATTGVEPGDVLECLVLDRGRR